MPFDLFFWLLICFPLNVALLASAFYQVLMLSDLEADYINPYDASSRINYYVVPEFIAQGLFCALFLFTGHWFMFLLMLPLASYHGTFQLVSEQHDLRVTYGAQEHKLHHNGAVTRGSGTAVSGGGSKNGYDKDRDS
ncbi:unnamed protein product [Vicia faba]|uniref:Uncharacterized protein n=1 Tax=Vicia faba TaxID=3906 RepID=A0AAV1AXZ4_VICFA|nr:unnamed protein product [Vicia faba]